MIEVRRGADRPTSSSPGIQTRHSFSSGAHYDPANTHFGRLVAHDEHVVQAGAGFDMHLHRAIDIVTWVLDGTLLHEDSAGNRNTVRPGMVQHLSAGSGIEHSERNGGDDELRFVQMWLLGESGTQPSYRVGESAALPLPGATLQVVRLAGRAFALPSAPFVHVFVVRGAADLTAAGALAAGDTARVSPCHRHRIDGDAELLVLQIYDTAPHSPV